MNKLIPFSQYTKTKNISSYLSDVFVVLDEKKIPLGFVFGRDSFISFLEKIDSEFESKVRDPKLAYSNTAGKLIDLIETHLPVKENFVAELKESISEAKKNGWVPFAKVAKSLNV